MDKEIIYVVLRNGAVYKAFYDESVARLFVAEKMLSNYYVEYQIDKVEVDKC